jgi:hypothetical protein
MKKGFVFVLILSMFSIQFLSAAAIDMKSQYNQGETIIAKISGNFIDPILQENVFFYRGHVKIPIDYEVTKINDYFYVTASLIGKTPDNYSMRIENVQHYESGVATNVDIISNFSISNTTADFSIKPGFVISSADFSIEVQNLKDDSLKISIKDPDKINSSDSINIGGDQIKDIDFQLGNITGDFFEIIKLSTSNLEYNIPIYIFGQKAKSYCGNGNIDSGESCDGTNWGDINSCSDFGFTEGDLSCYASGTSNECTFDTSDCVGASSQGYCGNGKIDAGEQCDGANWGTVKGCENFGFNSGTLSCDNCRLKTDNCFNTQCISDFNCSSGYKCTSNICKKQVECRENRDCKNNYTCSNNKCIAPGKECISDSNCTSDNECKDNKCVLKSSGCTSDAGCDYGQKCNKGICVDSSIQKTCLESGGQICGLDKVCSTSNSTKIGDNICCFDSCTDAPKSSTSKIIGWSLVIIVVLLLAFFYIKYKSTRRKVPDFVDLGKSRR